MWWKALKLGAMTVGGATAIGGLVFGTELGSYVHSSYSSVSSAVKDNIPVDFQLRRARDLLAATGPEMNKNVRLMAEQEVDIASLQAEIRESARSLDDEKLGLQKLRDTLSRGQGTYTYADITYTHEQLKDELSRRFQGFKQAEIALDQKHQLLENRKKALAAAVIAMDTARTQRLALESQIEALESRNRLVQATAFGTDVQVDNSRLAQAEKVVGDVRHQLDVSEHMLAQEAKFAHAIPMDIVDEKGLLSEVDAHLSGKQEAAPQAAAPQVSAALPDGGPSAVVK